MQETAISAGLPPAEPSPLPPGSEGPPRIRKSKHPLYLCLEPLASLRITVVLFALALILVFYGTWAQRELGNWTAIAQYFRSFIVLIPLRVIFCYAFPNIPGVIPFPGGWLLGSLMMINLLAAHAVRFRFTWRRSGILLTHFGLALMMVGEVVTGLCADEGRMTIEQGAAANYVEDDRKIEMAIIDSTDPRLEVVVAIPEDRLRGSEPIQDSQLPFNVEVKQYLVNSVLLKPDEKTNLATAGTGLEVAVKEQPEVSGTASDRGVDVQAAYVTFQSKEDGQGLGTYLVSRHFSVPQKVTVAGKTYHVAMRYKRVYKPYTVHLLEFRHDRYPGTNTPKNFSSLIRLVDPTTDENRTVKISMNDPLRYHGETFYQSSYLRGDIGTVLLVVQNPGWLLPYISCIIVTLGMLLHFGWMLGDFLGRIAA